MQMEGSIEAFVDQIMDTHGDAMLSVLAQYIANQVGLKTSSTVGRNVQLSGVHSTGASAPEVVCLGALPLLGNSSAQLMLH